MVGDMEGNVLYECPCCGGPVVKEIMATDQHCEACGKRMCLYCMCFNVWLRKYLCRGCDDVEWKKKYPEREGR